MNDQISHNDQLIKITEPALLQYFSLTTDVQKDYIWCGAHQPMKTEFSTLDICKVLEIDRERLRVWMDEGYISPSIQVATGQGTKNIFSREDVYLIALYRMMLDRLRVPREWAARVIKVLNKFQGVYTSLEQRAILLNKIIRLILVSEEGADNLSIFIMQEPDEMEERRLFRTKTYRDYSIDKDPYRKELGCYVVTNAFDLDGFFMGMGPNSNKAWQVEYFITINFYTIVNDVNARFE